MFNVNRDAVAGERRVTRGRRRRGTPRDRVQPWRACRVILRDVTARSLIDRLGLGLAITNRVARLHGLRLSFRRSEFGGLQADLST